MIPEPHAAALAPSWIEKLADRGIRVDELGGDRFTIYAAGGEYPIEVGLKGLALYYSHHLEAKDAPRPGKVAASPPVATPSKGGKQS